MTYKDGNEKTESRTRNQISTDTNKNWKKNSDNSREDKYHWRIVYFILYFISGLYIHMYATIRGFTLTFIWYEPLGGHRYSILRESVYWGCINFISGTAVEDGKPYANWDSKFFIHGHAGHQT